MRVGPCDVYGPSGGVLLVGQSRGNPESACLWPAELAGLSRAEFHRTFARTSIPQDRAQARGVALALGPYLWQWSAVVFLGRNVARAFGHHLPWFEMDRGEPDFVAVANVEGAREFWAQLAREAAEDAEARKEYLLQSLPPALRVRDCARCGEVCGEHPWLRRHAGWCRGRPECSECYGRLVPRGRAQ